MTGSRSCFHDDRDMKFISLALLGPFSSCESCSPAVDLRRDLARSALMHKAFDPAVSISVQDSSAEADSPHGVPERCCAVLLAPLDPENPVKHVSSAQTRWGRKQARSGSTGSPGEHSLPDMDCIALTGAEDGGLGSPDLPTELPPRPQGPFHKERGGKKRGLPQQDVAGQRLPESESLVLNEIAVA